MAAAEIQRRIRFRVDEMPAIALKPQGRHGDADFLETVRELSYKVQVSGLVCVLRVNKYACSARKNDLNRLYPKPLVRILGQLLKAHFLFHNGLPVRLGRRPGL